MKNITKKQLQEKVESLNKELEKQQTNFIYLQADFENYKKYMEKQTNEVISLANKSLVKELLQILDSLNQAAKNSKGINLIQKNFLEILNKNGLKKIETKKLDPYYHEVLQKVESEKPEDTIIEEFQTGYTLNSKVIRYSKVKVSGGNKNDKKQ